MNKDELIKRMQHFGRVDLVHNLTKVKFDELDNKSYTETVVTGIQNRRRDRLARVHGK